MKGDGRRLFDRKNFLPNTFSQRVVKLAQAIPAGRVTTYGRIARAAGGGNMSSQSITGILSKVYNNGITNIPFHRIVYADGKIWINEKHRKERLKLYKKEKIKINSKNKIENFGEVLLEF